MVGGKESGGSVDFLGHSQGHVGAKVTALLPGKPSSDERAGGKREGSR